MATTVITATDLALSGYNLTDSADFETLTTGLGNGVEFRVNDNHRIYLKNDTGGAAVFTVKVVPTAEQTARTISVTDETVSVADGKTWVYLPGSEFRQTSGNMIIECDVTGKVLVLAK